MALSRKSAVYRAELQSSSSVRFLSSLSSLSLLLWGSVTVLVWGWGAGRQTVLVTYMRDELGSCAPGSFTAVVLFYIYGAAAGPAVARCESHDSSAGNRDGPVILALHRLHVTAPVLIAVLFDDRRSPQHPAVCPQTRALGLRVHIQSSFVPFTDTCVHLFSRTLCVQHGCVHIQFY